MMSLTIENVLIVALATLASLRVDGATLGVLPSSSTNLAFASNNGPPSGTSDRNGPPSGTYDRNGPSSTYDRNVSPSGNYDRNRPYSTNDHNGPTSSTYDRNVFPSANHNRNVPSSTYVHNVPPSGNYDRNGPSSSTYDLNGPSSTYDRNGPSSSTYDRNGPSSSSYDRNGSPSGTYDRNGPATGTIDRKDPTSDRNRDYKTPNSASIDAQNDASTRLNQGSRDRQSDINNSGGSQNYRSASRSGDSLDRGNASGAGRKGEDASGGGNRQDNGKTTKHEPSSGATSTNSSGAGDAIAKSLQDNAAAIKKPIVQTIATVGSSQCENVKSALGLTYEQKKEGDEEPDVEKLELVFKHRRSVTVYKISDAEMELPRKLSNEKNLVIFIHGFTDDPSKASFQNISEAFLEKGGYDVIALDGSALIHWLYLRSSTYVRFMGEKLGATLAAMVRAGLDPKEVLVVGHSLGAHIAGFTGKQFRRLTGQRLGRISGLDPAGPCFTELDEQFRLNRDDADFVDAIHTDAGVYGIPDSVGQVDFYVNGGYMQPNCLSESCSHSRAWLYYTESVASPRAFPAKKCQDWRTFERNACGQTETTYMGLSTPSNVRGEFYLQTNGDSPYGRGNHGLVFDGDKAAAKKVIDAGEDVVNGFKSVAGKVLG